MPAVAVETSSQHETKEAVKHDITPLQQVKQELVDLAASVETKAKHFGSEDPTFAGVALVLRQLREDLTVLPRTPVSEDIHEVVVPLRSRDPGASFAAAMPPELHLDRDAVLNLRLSPEGALIARVSGAAPLSRITLEDRSGQEIAAAHDIGDLIEAKDDSAARNYFSDYRIFRLPKSDHHDPIADLLSGRVNLVITYANPVRPVDRVVFQR